MQDTISKYINEFSLDFEEKMITSGYSGPSKSENTDEEAFDLEIIKLIEIGIFDVSMLKYPNRQLIYTIWLNNQVHNMYVNKKLSVSDTAKMIYTLTRTIINRLWRYYNKGTKMMSIPFDYFPASGSELTKLIKQSEKSLIDIIKKCQAGSIYSDNYKELIKTKSKEYEDKVSQDIYDSYMYRNILLQFLVNDGNVEEIKRSV